MLPLLSGLKLKWKLWKTNQEMPILAPMSKDNVLMITAYLNKGNLAVSYKGQTRTGHFQDATLRKMFKGDNQRRKTAIESFIRTIAQLLITINN